MFYQNLPSIIYDSFTKMVCLVRVWKWVACINDYVLGKSGTNKTRSYSIYAFNFLHRVWNFIHNSESYEAWYICSVCTHKTNSNIIIIACLGPWFTSFLVAFTSHYYFNSNICHLDKLIYTDI
jgi:hypothetical protein